MELGKLGGNKTGFNVEACKVVVVGKLSLSRRYDIDNQRLTHIHGHPFLLAKSRFQNDRGL
jgi:hypothetical protein